jgi:hypothetical protein
VSSQRTAAGLSTVRTCTLAATAVLPVRTTCSVAWPAVSETLVAERLKAKTAGGGPAGRGAKVTVGAFVRLSGGLAPLDSLVCVWTT